MCSAWTTTRWSSAAHSASTSTPSGKNWADAVGLRAARADEASRDVEAWLKCWFVKERVGEDFSGTVTGVASFGIFVTLDTLHVEGLVHVSELGGEYFQFNDALHELRGERTGMRYRLTDKVQVQVSRVDLEARRIEFRLVQGTSFDALRKAAARGRTMARAESRRRRRLAGGPEGPDRQGAPRRGQEGRPASPSTRRRKAKEVGPPRGATRLLRGAATDRQSRLRAAPIGAARGEGVALVFLAFLLALAPGGFWRERGVSCGEGVHGDPGRVSHYCETVVGRRP